MRGSSANVPVDIKTDKCAAYEIIALKQQKVIMNENPAYEEIGHYANDQFNIVAD